MWRVIALGLLALVAGTSPSFAEACQIQNARKAGETLVCVYNCNGKIVTLTSAGNVCPVILE